ncbi:MAG: flagellar basal-body MS-ring/collar protein FliF [Deltaproteobacteria bacterium]|nr:flagellar basal-body MS-ring/collar protein FliF [Deltaproteobacteria bacterium]
MAEERGTGAREILPQFQNFFQSLTLAKKIILFAMIGVVIAGMVSMAYIANRETWAPLYTNLTAEDSALIQDKLQKNQVPVMIGPGGTAILVPPERADEARIILARERVTLGGGLGFADLFVGDKGIGETEFQQQVKFRMALEGELARLISKLENIQAAKVTLALPKKSLFIDQEQHPTASVVVTGRRGDTLNRGLVLTIAQLVANAVEGLKKENVVVVDHSGRLLSKGVTDTTGAGDFQEHFLFRHNLEQMLEAKIISQLEPVVGVERVKARVAADLAFDKITSNEEVYDPDASVVRSEQSTTENSSGSRSIPVGIPGVASNLPETAAGASEVANVSQIAKTNETRNYETTVRRTTREPSMGQVNRLSVSVLMDGKYKPITDAATGRIITTQYEEWSTDEKKEIERLIKAAVGFNPRRGDSLEVVNLRFSKPVEEDITEQNETTQRNRKFFLDILRYTFLGVGLLALIMFVIRPMVQRLSAKPEELDLLMGLPATIGELEGEELEIPTEREVGLPPRDQILQIARADPLATASLIRTWLREKR